MNIENFTGRPQRIETILSKEGLSDQQMGILLSAVGNKETKALTLLVMRRGETYSGKELHSRFINVQGGITNAGWATAEMVPYNYAKYSFAPAKLASEDGAEITQYGETIGKPFAALLLDFSRKHSNFSLSDFFGETPSTKDEEQDVRKSAPFARFRILQALLEADLPIRQADISEKNEDIYHQLIKLHLQGLNRKGIIEYSSIETDRPYASYTFNPAHPKENPAAYGTDPTLTQAVYQIVQQNPQKEWKIPEVTEEYAKRFTGRLTEEQKKKITGRITGVLSHLESSGYAQGGKFNKDTHSEINLSETQRNAIAELVNLLENFQRQDSATMARGRFLADLFLLNPQEVSILMEKAKEHSPFSNKKGLGEHRSTFLKLISQNPGISTREIDEKLNTDDLAIGRTRINQILSSLLKEGEIEVEKRRYRIKVMPSSNI